MIARFEITKDIPNRRHLKRGNTQINGHIGSMSDYQTVDIWKRGRYLKNGHKRKVTNPLKRTTEKGIRIVKWTFGIPKSKGI